MANRIGDIAHDDIYLVVTINVRSTTIRMLTRPVKLKPNEYCYHLSITTDFKQWEDRTSPPIKLTPVNPPQITPLGVISASIGKSVEERVTEVLTGEG